MGARRVEVSQQAGIPFLDSLGVTLFLCFGALRADVVGDHEFRGEFRVSVRVGWAEWAFFGDGDHAGDTGGIAVDRGRGGVDNVGDIVAGSGAQEGEGAVDIDTVVVQGDLSGFSHGFEGSEVDDTVNVGVFLEDFVQGFFVGDVDLVVLRSSSTD